MFDIGATELLLIVIIAIVVIGPSEMPRALRTAGQWIAKIRRVSAHFRTGLDAMIREAELEDMEKEWKAQNAKIMADHPDDQMQPLDGSGEASAGPTDLTDQIHRDDPAPPPPPDAASAEARASKASNRVRPEPDPMAQAKSSAKAQTDDEPQLPLSPKSKG